MAGAHVGRIMGKVDTRLIIGADVAHLGGVERNCDGAGRHDRLQ